jgi:hypothetical protein
VDKYINAAFKYGHKIYALCDMISNPWTYIIILSIIPE